MEGPTPEKDYGIQLAERIGFPQEIIKAAQWAMDQLRTDFYDVNAIVLTKESILRRLKRQLVQSLKRIWSNQHMPHSQRMRLLIMLRENYHRAINQTEQTAANCINVAMKSSREA
jgi:DNA mismatch repair ATPase MutS